MTKKEKEIIKQNELSRHFDLSFWYGVQCKKCCDVYPEFKTTSGFDSKCYYQCSVCGKRTLPAAMPWISVIEWNNDEFVEEQIEMEL